MQMHVAADVCHSKLFWSYCSCRRITQLTASSTSTKTNICLGFLESPITALNMHAILYWGCLERVCLNAEHIWYRKAEDLIVPPFSTWTIDYLRFQSSLYQLIKESVALQNFLSVSHIEKIKNRSYYSTLVVSVNGGEGVRVRNRECYRVVRDDVYYLLWKFWHDKLETS